MAQKLAGINEKQYVALSLSERAVLRDRARTAQASYAITDKVATLPKRKLEAYPEFLTAESFEYRRARSPSTLNKHGFIYIVKHPTQYDKEGVLKIGFASNLKSRLVAANTWSFSGSFEYVDYAPVSNMRAAEAMLHRMFSETRLHGEWFRTREVDARSMLTMVAGRFPLTDTQKALFVCPEANQSEKTS